MRALSIAAALLTIIASCASSPLPPAGEPAFERSQERLRSGLTAVLGAQRAPAPDETLFAQAEAFFHYRYTPAPAGAGTFLFEAAAATLEFGPLSVLAASEGLGDLRLHAYDGAIQLYEAMLQRWPATRLRALALYRLGWAYRNATLGGFPRTSDAAFAELERDPAAGPLAPLAAEARRIPWKSQDTALSLSLIPGAGQMYAGRVGNGIVRLSVALAFAAAALVPIFVMAHENDLTWWGTAISIGGFVGLQVIYTDSYQTALQDAITWNERRQREFEQAHPASP